MSIFEGVLKELPNVSVDRFDGENLKSTCFFLSHCHSDHMHGLKDGAFASYLRNHEDYFIYCSPVSALILKSFELDFDELHIKEVNHTVLIKVPANESCPVDYNVTVTVIPAGHCPGSVMFLFETAHQSYLYTGDFRFAEGDVQKLTALQNKKIDQLYFDATFLNHKYWKFPSRKESLEELVKLIDDWLEKNPKKTVHLETSARYGSEYLFIKLAKEFKTKIAVDESLYNLYWNLPEIGHMLTSKTEEAKIYVHARLNNSPCGNDNVLHIQLSAQWYRWIKDQPKPEIFRISSTGRKKSYRVCFATHSSCSELVEFLNYLKPKRLHACTTVVGLSESEKKKYIHELQESWIEDEETEKSLNKQITVVTNNFENLQSPLKIKIPKSNKEIRKKMLESPPIRRQRLSFNKSTL